MPGGTLDFYQSAPAALSDAAMGSAQTLAGQHAQLAALGCDSCQGYYFARPMPAGDIDTLTGQPLARQPVSG